MAIEVELKGEEIKEIDYPCLMEAEGGLVALFIKPKHGIVLKGDKIYSVGEINESFGMSYFTTYKGELTLKNK